LTGADLCLKIQVDLVLEGVGCDDQNMESNVKKALQIILSGTEQVTPLPELEAKLQEGRPLRIKLGADPTAPDLHLGHAVVFEKLRQLQQLGHEIYFLIGDFTARIGDPTGKSQTRKPLETAEILENAKTYLAQLGKILDTTKTRVVYNSHWLGNLNLSETIKVMAKTTLAQLLAREDFATRLQHNQSIGFHELLYPLLQGYDSVFLNADIELGGTDQTFNLLMGRQLQEQFGQKAQVIITLPILEGLDGVQKMSKSLGNYIGLFEEAQIAFGKLMSIGDVLMWRYWLLLGGKTEAEVAQMRTEVEQGTLHPMLAKKELAQTIVAKFWSAQEAKAARHHFEAIFQDKDFSAAQEICVALPATCWIVDLLKAVAAVESSSQAKRLLEEGAVKLDGQVITGFKAPVTWNEGSILVCGKKFVARLKR
jgi:tyrosyl-tRNA synthetase